jgi:hypothetical protein
MCLLAIFWRDRRPWQVLSSLERAAVLGPRRTSVKEILLRGRRPPLMLWPRWIWLRALGCIFLSAFYSLAFQITGLNGPRGILAAGEYLEEVKDAYGGWAIWFSPTLF